MNQEKEEVPAWLDVSLTRTRLPEAVVQQSTYSFSFVGQSR